MRMSIKSLRLKYSRKSGFTGHKEDAAGRNQCYSDGHHVACNQPENPQVDKGVEEGRSGPVGTKKGGSQAKVKSELERWAVDNVVAKSEGKPNWVDYSETSSEVANEINSVYSEYQRMYNIKGAGWIGPYSRINKEFGQNIPKHLFTTFGNEMNRDLDTGGVGGVQMIGYSSKLAKNKATVEATLAKGRELGYTTIDDLHGALVHEVGHAVRKQARGGMKASRELWEGALAGLSKGEITKEALLKAVGTYGGSSENEFFSEVFRLYHENKLPKELYFAKEILGQLKKSPEGNGP